jgi:hypothetical protein
VRRLLNVRLPVPDIEPTFPKWRADPPTSHALYRFAYAGGHRKDTPHAQYRRVAYHNPLPEGRKVLPEQEVLQRGAYWPLWHEPLTKALSLFLGSLRPEYL